MSEASETRFPSPPSPVRSAVAFLVHSNLFVSVSATSVALTTVLLADLPLDPVPLFIVFAATLFVYSFNRITDIAEDEQNVPGRARFTRRYGKALFAAGVVLYVAAIATAILLDLPGAPFILLPVLVGGVYSVGRAKRMLLVKNLVVGVAWGIIPLGAGVYYGVLFSPGILFLSCFFAVEVTVAAALFDVKDIQGDKEEGIRTFPNSFGPRATRLGAAAVLVALVPVVVVAGEAFSNDLLILLGFLAYALAYVPFATRERGPLFYGFVVDGEHVFVALVAVAAELVGII